MVGADPGAHVWGLGRHAIGSNFFWYLCDPAGNFAEYVSDLDRITDAAAYAPPTGAAAVPLRLEPAAPARVPHARRIVPELLA